MPTPHDKYHTSETSCSDASGGEHRKIAQGRPAMMGRLALIILMLTLPLSATAQSVGGNPLIGRQAAATLWPAIRSMRSGRSSELRGYRPYAFHHGSFLESISSLKSQRDA